MAMVKQGQSSTTSCRSVATWSGVSAMVVGGGLATSCVSVAFVSHHSASSAHPSIGEHRQYEQSDNKAFLSPATAAPPIGSQVSPAGILAACGVAATVATALRRSSARSSGRLTMQAKYKLFDEDASGNVRFALNGPPMGMAGFTVGSKAAGEAAGYKKAQQEAMKAAVPMKAVARVVSSKASAAPTKPLPPSATRGEEGKEYAGLIGDTLPLRYWDPLGLASSGDDVDFRRRRMAEIKNGRVAMIAAMGYIAPEFFRWPGYCSPSMNLKFTDIPNGIGALYKIPAEGWAQIGVFIGFLELFPLRQENNRVPGDFKTCGRLGVPWFFILGQPGNLCDPERSKRGLDAELNNGRLAMAAITGMILQNGVTGTTGGEMWLGPGA